MNFNVVLTCASITLSLLHVSTALLLWQLLGAKREPALFPYPLAGIFLCFVAWMAGYPGEGCFFIATASSLVFFLAYILSARNPKYRAVAYLFLVSVGFSLVVSTLWTLYLAEVIAAHSTPWFQIFFILINVVWWILGTSASTLGWFAQYLPLLARYRERPVDQYPHNQGFSPKVSIHVPCYMEPPQVVIRTLRALSLLDYGDFEVILVDNNTNDPSLWKPLEAECARLGSRFKFFHVEGLEGAKGGALNYALERTDPSAEIIAVLDSDFESSPQFLAKLVPFFARPEIAFLQTPHDYRDYEHSSFLRGCYWEYRRKHALVYPGMNEWDAGLLAGTMCLVRKSSLLEVGAWSTTCICEDSELSLRLGLAGYQGQYIIDTFGRGLIPETFFEYRKQRSRWIAGTVQQLRIHWRSVLFFWWNSENKRASSMKMAMCFLYRAGLLVDVLTIIMLMSFFILCTYLILKGMVVTIPVALLILIVVSATSQLISLEVMRELMQCSRRDMSRAILSGTALTHIRILSAFEGIARVRPFHWNRTNKFTAQPNRFFSLGDVVIELSFSLLGFILGFLFWYHAHPAQLDLVTFASLAAFILGILWATSAYIAVRADLDLRKREEISVENLDAVKCQIV